METAQNYPNIPQARNIQPQYQHEVITEAQESEDDGLNLGSILGTIRRRAIVVGLITTAATGAVASGRPVRSRLPRILDRRTRGRDPQH